MNADNRREVMLQRLEQNRARLVTQRRAVALAATFTLTAAVCLVVLLLDWWLRAGTPGRVVWLLLQVAALGYGAWRWLVPAWRWSPSMQEIALLHERAFPSFNALLVTALEPHAGSDRFMNLVLDNADERCRAEPLDTLIDWRPFRPRLIAAGVLLALWLGMLVAWPGGVGTWLARTAAPWSEARWPTRTQVQWTEVPERVKRGTTLLVRGRCEGWTPAVVTLQHRRTTGGRWQSQPVRLDADGTFEGAITPALYNMDLRVLADDGTSDIRAVEVVIPPDVESLHVAVTQPAYSRLPAFAQEDGRVEALIGSEVVLSVTPTRPAAAAVLHFQGGTTQPMTARDAVWTASFELIVEDRYEVELIDAYGFTSDSRSAFDLLPIPDHLPDVALVQPEGEKRVTPLSRVRLVARGEDDYGVTGARLAWRVAPEGETKTTPLPLRPGPSVEVRHEWDLAGVGLAPGERVNVWVEMTDEGLHPGGPQAGRSPQRTLNVMSPDALRAALSAEAGTLFGRLEDIERALRQNVDELTRLQAIGEIDAVEAVLRTSQWRQEELQRRLETIGAALQALADDLEASNLATPPEIEGLRQSGGELLAVADEDLQVILAGLHEARTLLLGGQAP